MTQVGIQKGPVRYSQPDQFLIRQHQPAVRVFIEKHFPSGQKVVVTARVAAEAKPSYMQA